MQNQCVEKREVQGVLTLHRMLQTGKLYRARPWPRWISHLWTAVMRRAPRTEARRRRAEGATPRGTGAQLRRQARTPFRG